MSDTKRVSTGVERLDELLGGGLFPGTLTVIAGATGCGKTQLGLQFCQAGLASEGHRGVVFDMACRGDSQNHSEYARRMFDWRMTPVDPGIAPDLERFFTSQRARGDFLHIFDYHGRRVTRRDLDQEDWRQWQAEVSRKLSTAIGFLYGNFIEGARRVVIDGIEPVDRPSESIQIELFEYVYHQILRKDPQWVARDLFRQDYRRQAQAAAAHSYRPEEIACVLLYTSHDALLDELISRRLDEGDALANANTVIYLGRVREGSRIRRALYIPKHRGSRCSEEIVPYEIDDRGIKIE